MYSEQSSWELDMTVETKYCIVCKQGSTREDWQGKDVVACDHHSKDEVEKAKAASQSNKKTAS